MLLKINNKTVTVHQQDAQIVCNSTTGFNSMCIIIYLLGASISYFHDHAQCVIPTLLAGHWFYKYHAFRAKTIFFLFSRSFHHCAVFISHCFVRVTRFREIFKTCGPPEQLQLHTAHDCENSLLGKWPVRCKHNLPYQQESRYHQNSAERDASLKH